jgi:hypothetical protein
MFVCYECCVLSGRGLCDELITRPEESYRLCCVYVLLSRNLKNEEAASRVGLQGNKKIYRPIITYVTFWMYRKFIEVQDINYFIPVLAVSQGLLLPALRPLTF